MQVILAKASLSEWANFRGKVPSGFCGRGGQGTNPYYPNANPSGSSSGSGIGTAIGLAAGEISEYKLGFVKFLIWFEYVGSLGTETDGSIVSPSSHCNLVGIKATVGLISRAGGCSRLVFFLKKKVT